MNTCSEYITNSSRKQEDAPELQRRVSGCIRTMSRLLSEPAKAEEGFQILNQLKDVNIWKMLTALLDPSTSFTQAWSFRVHGLSCAVVFKVLKSSQTCHALSCVIIFKVRKSRHCHALVEHSATVL